MRTRERSAEALMAFAQAAACWTRAQMEPVDLWKAKRSRRISWTPRMEQCPMRMRARMNCLIQALVTGR